MRGCLQAGMNGPAWCLFHDVGMKQMAKYLPTGRTFVIAIPLLWLFIFFILPLAFVLKISVSEVALQRPPYLPLFEWAEEGVLRLSINFGNYAYLIDDSLYLNAYLESLKIAGVSTIFCLLIGYPMAYFIARAKSSARTVLLLLVILPFWTSFLLRVYAWIGILKPKGILNSSLMSLGVISEPLPLLQNDFATYLGITYTYLPFMILPLYANLAKLDGTLLEAAADLGSKPLVTFLTVTLPLSFPGILAGSLLVFIPAIGEFVIPALLGGPDTLMIGRILWDEFFSNRDWPVASAVAIVMLVLIVLPLMLLRNAQKQEGVS